MTLAKTARPSKSCRDLRVPMTSSRSAEPFPRSEVSIWSLTDIQCAWIVFPPKEKIGFSEMGGLCSLSQVSSLPLWELILLLAEKRKEAAFAKLKHSQDLLSHGCCQMTPARSCRHCSVLSPDRRRMKQKPEKRAQVSQHHKRETNNRTESTEKVERLKDNQRGLSEVIYNRDCKMVN